MVIFEAVSFATILRGAFEGNYWISSHTNNMWNFCNWTYFLFCKGVRKDNAISQWYKTFLHCHSSFLIPCHAFIEHQQMGNRNHWSHTRWIQFSLLTHVVFRSSSRDSTSHLYTLCRALYWLLNHIQAIIVSILVNMWMFPSSKTYYSLSLQNLVQQKAKYRRILKLAVNCIIPLFNFMAFKTLPSPPHKSRC